MRKNLVWLRILVLVVVFGGGIVLATRLHGGAAAAVWIVLLVLLVAVVVSGASAKPTVKLDDATKRVFAQWQAAHPERRFTPTPQPLPDPADWRAPHDPALVGRFSGEPPFAYDTRNMKIATATFLARTEVAGQHVLVLEQGMRDSKLHTVVRQRVTAVSLDTPTLIRRVSLYRLAGYQRAGWYRAIAFWRFTTGDPAFDRRFRVVADNGQDARRLLTPALTQFLAADPRSEHVGVTFERGTLNVWLRDNYDADAIGPMIDLLMELYSRIPAQGFRNVG